MAGNVLEWVADWYGVNYYQISPNHNPKGPETGSARVLRGGSWLIGNSDYFQCAYRSNYPLTFRYENYGFRCARTP
jgi:formylglycine-generating enzyme required for sulfatase activity